VREYLEKGSQELKVERMSISLKCQYYGNKISYPIRSKHCSSHYQPFDLNNFIFSSLQAKNSTKKWKCPICDKRAYDIIVDGYVLDVMRKNSRAMEITFQSDGSPVARDDLSSQHEEEHELQLRKEKKDPKNS
jgi:SUMO ligase MMS21 Smc5/6 complex component